VGAGDGGLLDDPEKFEGEIGLHRRYPLCAGSSHLVGRSWRAPST
jgi:hypothetical protein